MKTQIKFRVPVKFYPKRYEDVCRFDTWEKRKQHVTASGCSVDELIAKFRSFYKEAYASLFDMIVKQVWLEQHVSYKNWRRTRRRGNCLEFDLAYGQFMKIAVGASQRVLTASVCFTPVATYLIDFFPEFLFHDPFKNPEKYKYPYEHVTLDFLVFVHQMDNRFKLLSEAEERGMSYAEFINWVYNWAFCYNEDTGKEIYQLRCGHNNWPYIKNTQLKGFWENKKFNFNVLSK